MLFHFQSFLIVFCVFYFELFYLKMYSTGWSLFLKTFRTTFQLPSYISYFRKVHLKVIKNLIAENCKKNRFVRLVSRTKAARWSDNFDRSDTTFPSVEWIELLSLRYLTDWINVSSCVHGRPTIAFIFWSTSLEIILRSSSCDPRFSCPSLGDSPERWHHHFQRFVYLVFYFLLTWWSGELCFGIRKKRIVLNLMFRLDFCFNVARCSVKQWTM